MKYQQENRIEKIKYESNYLQDKKEENNKFIFTMCGSTKNIYKVQLYFNSKMIYCNCPDARKWCKIDGIICKHSCFVLIKILNFKKCLNYESYFNSYIFNDFQMDFLKINLIL